MKESIQHSDWLTKETQEKIMILESENFELILRLGLPPEGPLGWGSPGIVRNPQYRSVQWETSKHSYNQVEHWNDPFFWRGFSKTFLRTSADFSESLRMRWFKHGLHYGNRWLVKLFFVFKWMVLVNLVAKKCRIRVLLASCVYLSRLFVSFRVLIS